MTLPDPEVGLVIRFNYLWRREHEQGRENARYPRPCAIVVARREISGGAPVVLVVHITHSEPTAGTVTVEIPQSVKRHLGLDDKRSWIIADEVNEFSWPGYDLDTAAVGNVAYGYLPDRLFQRVRSALMESIQAGRLGRVSR